MATLLRVRREIGESQMLLANDADFFLPSSFKLAIACREVDGSGVLNLASCLVNFGDPMTPSLAATVTGFTGNAFDCFVGVVSVFSDFLAFLLVFDLFCVSSVILRGDVSLDFFTSVVVDDSLDFVGDVIYTYII